MNSNIIHVLQTHGFLAKWAGNDQIRVRNEFAVLKFSKRFNGARKIRMRVWHTIPATYQAASELLGIAL